MPAIVGGLLYLGLALVYHRVLIHPHGGWQALRACRRSHSPENRLVWNGLKPVERGWYYFLPIAYLMSMALVFFGLAIELLR